MQWGSGHHHKSPGVESEQARCTHRGSTSAWLCDLYVCVCRMGMIIDQLLGLLEDLMRLNSFPVEVDLHRVGMGRHKARDCVSRSVCCFLRLAQEVMRRPLERVCEVVALGLGIRGQQGGLCGRGLDGGILCLLPGWLRTSAEHQGPGLPGQRKWKCHGLVSKCLRLR